MPLMHMNKRSSSDELSLILRERTLEAHQEAERAMFVQDLMAGRLPVAGYIRLAAQHHAVYGALEAAVEASVEPALAPLLDPALNRLDALQRDLDFLAGPGWADDYPTLSATERYVAHIVDRCTASPVALLAHHYIRYLGDLSGGQVIGRILRRTYGLSDDRGTEFYSFPRISSPKQFKEHYRDHLDALDWTEDQRAVMIAEVNTAYQLNTAVFEALAQAVSPSPRTV